MRYKVNQRTHDIKYSIPTGCIYRLWLSMEGYEQNKAEKVETKELREKFHNTIDVMTLSPLRKLNEMLFK